MADEYEITYKGKNYIVEADWRKSDDHYIGSNTFDIDIVSVKEVISDWKEETVCMDGIDIAWLTSELAYLLADEYHRE